MKYIIAAFLILICIACIDCSFKYKPVYPFYFWFGVSILGLYFVLF